MAENIQNKSFLANSPFYILLIFMVILGLSYLGIWSYINNSVKGAIIFSIFFALTITGVIFSFLYDTIEKSSWTNNCNLFLAGFLIWSLLGLYGGQAKSILSVSTNNLLSSISGEIPQLIDFLSTVFVVPIAEEIFWMITIPFSVITILDIASKGKTRNFDLKFFGNKWFQLVIIMFISAWTFAEFHVGKQALTFIIAAMIFRGTQIFLVFGDRFFDLFKWVSMALSFSVGAHIGNNWASYGLLKGINLLNNNMFPVGIIIYGFFIICILTTLNWIGEGLPDANK
jgi:hypothetical protein